MNIQQWAIDKYKEHKNEINYYIKEGIEKDKAVEMVLENSVIGAGYKAQIRYDFKFKGR